MIPYKLYLDLSGGLNPEGYFEVSAVSVAPFTEQAIDNSVTTRKQWGDVQLKNKPFNGVMLYDQITELKPTQEIHLKFVSAYETIIGYFGIVDCKLNDDQKVLNINVTTLDQYTEFLENRDEEVKLFDEGNVIVNGDFKDGTNNSPNSWTFDGWTNSSEYLFLEKKYVDSRSAVALSDNIALKELIDHINPTTGLHEYTNSPYPDGKIPFYQEVLSILKDRQMNLSFFWSLTGNDSKNMDLAFDVFLYDPTDTTHTYRLLKDGENSGKWSALLPVTTETEPFYYKQDATQFPYDQLTLLPKNISIEKAPIAGNLKILFYRYTGHGSNWSNVWETNVKLLLTNVVIYASAIKLNTISIEFNSENLVTLPQEKVYWKDHVIGKESYLYKWDKNQSLNIEDMFDSEGKPLLGAMPMTTNNKMTYADLVSVFESDKTHKSYRFELSEITVFKGAKTQALLSQSRYYYGVAKFSREEIYFKFHEYTQDDFENGLCSESEIGTEEPPENNSQWEYIGTPETPGSDLKLWVRKPFGSSEIPWTLGVKSTSTKLRSYNGLFDYYDSLTSVKQYPVESSNTLEINNAIELRELIKQVYQQTHISLRGKNVYSNFLWNDTLSPEEEDLVYLGNDENCNYVTMTDSVADAESKNVLNNILAVHTYEFIPAESRTANDEEKSILKTSAKKLLDDILVLFPQCYWFIDELGDLHIEHLKYFDRINSAKDLTKSKYKYLGQYSEWEYIKEKLYSKEEYTTKNSGYVDFNKSIVTFDKITSNKRGEDIKGSYSTSILSTDVQYCAENPTSLDNGIVLIACTADNKAKYGRGQYSGKQVINGDLSIATLLEQYGTYEGTWEEGLINGKGTNSNNKQTFYNTTRSRQGKEITVKGILLEKIVLTKLGIGLVKSRTIDYQNEITRLTCVYRHDDMFIGFGDGEAADLGGGNIVSPELPDIGLRDNQITDITQTTATFNGNILNDGGSPVTARGFVYSTSPMPTLETGIIVSGGSGIGFYSVPVTGLTAQTSYFICEFATNSKGTAYGDYQYAFTTLAAPMSVTTSQPVNPSVPNVTITATVISSGGMTLVRGIVWSIYPSPTTNDNVEFGSVGGVGQYTAIMDNIQSGRTYYVRAYISDMINAPVYGNEITFTI